MTPTGPKYFDPAAVAARTAAADQMYSTLQNDDLDGFRTAAAQFLNPANCDPGMHLPVNFYFVVVTPEGHLVNCLNGGPAYDVNIDPPGTVPDGCKSPWMGEFPNAERFIGQPNVAGTRQS